MKLHIILTGASGMVGEGVMHECLLHPDVEHVLVVGRRECGTTHPKLKEILVSDLFNLVEIENELAGYDGCYFCLGTSSVGMKEDAYRKVTYDLTMNFAKTVARLNPSMTFCYISGAGTDTSESGKMMWARVKGKTENDLSKLPFKHEYNFRPGFIEPTKGLNNTLKIYSYTSWMIPVLRLFARRSIVSLREIGLAMIAVTKHGWPNTILEIQDIAAAARTESHPPR